MLGSCRAPLLPVLQFSYSNVFFFSFVQFGTVTRCIVFGVSEFCSTPDPLSHECVLAGWLTAAGFQYRVVEL